MNEDPCAGEPDGEAHRSFMTPDSSLSVPVATPVRRLLSIQDEEDLEEALAEVEAPVAAQAVALAPTLEQKTTLLWAMEDRQRRDALDLVPPPLVAALVQNLEDDNRYLLGDLSLEQFRALMTLCSPERKWYWITTALSFTDARANLLPLLMPTRELVEILLTRAEFEEHLRTLAEYPIENQRIPGEMLDDPAQALVDLFGPDNLLRQFPVSENGLAQVLQTILTYDADRYVDIIRAGLRALNYQENRPEEWDDLTEAPVLLDHLEPIERAGGTDEPTTDPLTYEVGPPVALVPIAASPLARLADGLAPAVAQRVAGDLQQLYIRQAVAEGGSFLEADLRRVARSIEAYLLLGLRAEAGDSPEAQSGVLGNRPLHRVSQSGARVIEGLRQVAFRLRPLERVLSPEQRSLLNSLARPRMTTVDGVPRLQLLPAGNLPADVDVETAATMLQEVTAWTALARVLGLDRTVKALEAAGGVVPLLEELAMTAAFFGRIALGLTEPEDRRRFTQRFLSRVEREPLPEAREAVRRAVEAWASEHNTEPGPVAALLNAALDRLGAAALRGEDHP